MNEVAKRVESCPRHSKRKKSRDPEFLVHTGLYHECHIDMYIYMEYPHLYLYIYIYYMGLYDGLYMDHKPLTK